MLTISHFEPLYVQIFSSLRILYDCSHDLHRAAMGSSFKFYWSIQSGQSEKGR